MMRSLKGIGLVLCLACAGLGEGLAPAPAPAPTSEPAGGELFAPPPRAAVGQCLHERAVVDCGTLHDDEVFSAFAVPSPRPDDEALSTLASDTCEADFAAYVGEPAPTSGYSVGWVIPDGDGDVICLLFGREARRGSARGQSH